MKEITAIIRAFDQAASIGLHAALATVVKVEGSSYRQPGARMLVTEDGILTGAISGGCLEGDALRKALLCIDQKRNKLITYDTSNEEDAEFGVQLGCNGIVHILFEHIDTSEENHPIALLKLLEGQRSDAVTLTIFSLDDRLDQPGTVLFKKDGKEEVVSTAGPHGLITQATAVLMRKETAVLDIVANEITYQGLYQFHTPALSLVIAGAGNDVKPLVAAAAIPGWEITVVDGRASHARTDRFPAASQVITAKAPDVLDQLQIDGNTLFLLMTHNYKYDIALLKTLLPTVVPYIGILGPKSKWQRMRDDLEQSGIVLSTTDQERIFTPVGLDIGAETSEEIAISIVAEIQAFLKGKTGTSLKFKPGKIHNEKQQSI